MRQGSTYRAERRTFSRTFGIDMLRMDEKPGPGRRMKWLQRHPKLAPYWALAHEMLSTGEKSQQPKWKAVRKMMVALAVAPKVRMIGVGIVPYQASLGRHERGSWRSFPRVVIDANLQVAQ